MGKANGKTFEDPAKGPYRKMGRSDEWRRQLAELAMGQANTRKDGQQAER